MTTAAEATSAIRRERDRVLATIDELGERATERGAAGEWSAREVLAHFTAWSDLTIGVLAPAHPRGTHEFPGQDELNRRAAERVRDAPLAAVRDDFVASAEALCEVVFGLPEGDLDAAGRLPWALELTLGQFVSENSYGHWPEHDEEMRAWAGLPARAGS